MKSIKRYVLYGGTKEDDRGKYVKWDDYKDASDVIDKINKTLFWYRFTPDKIGSFDEEVETILREYFTKGD